MDCRKVLLHLNQYNDEELSSELVTQVEEHLEKCELCRAELSLTREMDMMLLDSYEPEPSSDFVTSVMTEINRKPRRTAFMSRFSHVLAGAFSFLLVFTAGMLLTTVTSVNVDANDSDPVLMLTQYAAEEDDVSVISGALFDKEDVE